MKFNKLQMKMLWEAWSHNLPKEAPQAIDDLTEEFKLWCTSKGIEEKD